MKFWLPETSHNDDFLRDPSHFSSLSPTGDFGGLLLVPPGQIQSRSLCARTLWAFFCVEARTLQDFRVKIVRNRQEGAKISEENPWRTQILPEGTRIRGVNPQP